MTRPVHLTVDGQTQTLSPGSTVADIRDARMIKASPGALLSLKGSVIESAGGEPATIKRNGAVVELSQRVSSGDDIVSTSGTDVTEKSITVTETVSVTTRNEGSGPVLKVLDPGVEGVAQVVKGQVSGVKISSKILDPGKPMVVMHSRPTSGDKLVALTFDDGPWPGQTEKILDILAQQQVKATFFMLGSRVKAAPALARRVRDEGHLVAGHSLSHKNLPKEKPAEINRQIAAGTSAIKRATGIDPVWFRPPYGAVNGKVMQQARLLKVRVALWDIDTLDWTKPGVARLVRNAVKPIKPGAVILMHDGGVDRSQTIAALPQIIEKLKAQGYTFVTLEELAATK